MSRAHRAGRSRRQRRLRAAQRARARRASSDRLPRRRRPPRRGHRLGPGLRRRRPPGGEDAGRGVVAGERDGRARHERRRAAGLGGTHDRAEAGGLEADDRRSRDAEITRDLVGDDGEEFDGVGLHGNRIEDPLLGRPRRRRHAVQDRDDTGHGAETVAARDPPALQRDVAAIPVQIAMRSRPRRGRRRGARGRRRRSRRAPRPSSRAAARPRSSTRTTPSRSSSSTSASVASATSRRVCCSSPAWADARASARRSSASWSSSSNSDWSRRRSRRPTPRIRKNTVAPATAAPIGTRGDAAAGVSAIRQVRPPTDALATVAPPGPCARTAGPSVTRTSSPFGRPENAAFAELLRRERPDDDPEQGVAALRRRVRGRSRAKTGTKAKVPRPPLRSRRRRRETWTAGAAGAAERCAERGVGAEVEHVRGVADGLLAQQRIREGGAAGAPIRTCSPDSTAPRCAAETRGAQPTATISGRARGRGRGSRRQRRRQTGGVVGGADALSASTAASARSSSPEAAP